MSAYQELLAYTRQLERRVAKQERQESGGYTKSEANSLFVTYTYAADNFIDIGAYADFLNVDGGATGALLHTQIFDHGIEARDGVWGGGGANDDLILEGTSHATKTSSYVILQPTGGNVGIGTSTPSAKLHVVGAGISAHATEATSWAATANASSKLDLTTDASNVGMALRVAKGTERYTTNATTVGFLQYGSSVDQFELVHGTNTRITVSATGNVGIGAAPGEKLDVNGNILIPNNNFYKAKNASGTAIQLLGIDASNNVFMGAVGNAGGAVYIREDGSNVITITGGDVGIGTTPGAKLDIGTGALKTVETSVTEAYFESTGVRMKNIYTGGGWARGLLTYEDSAGTDYFSIGAFGSGQTFTWAYIGPAYNSAWLTFRSNNVGINTTTNTVPLKLSILSGVTTANTSTPTVMLGSDRTDYYASIDSVRGSASTYLGLAFSTSNNATPAEAMRIAPSGNVGIGTTDPGTSQLYVNSAIDTAISIVSTVANKTPKIIFGNATRTWDFLVNGTGGELMFRDITAGNLIRATFDTAGKLGIGTTGPEEKLHVSAGNILISNNQWYEAENSGGTNIRLAGIDGSNNVYLGAIDNAGGAVYIREDGSTIVSITGGNVGIGTTSPAASAKLQVEGKVGIKTGVNAIDGQLFIYQDSSSGTCAVLDLAQEDLSEEFINFKASNGAGNPIDTAAIGTYYGKVRVAVNGTFKYMALYNS